MTKLPKGWRVEMLGLIEAVQFTSPYGAVLLWGDGEWRMGSAHGTMPAPGVPPASSMTEARKVGTAWIESTWEATA